MGNGSGTITSASPCTPKVCYHVPMRLYIEVEPRLPYALTLPAGADEDDAYDILCFFNDYAYSDEDSQAGDKEYTLVPVHEETHGTLAETLPQYSATQVKVKDITSVLAFRN